MSPIRKLQLRASEVRTKLNELGAVEQPTDEQRAEIGKLSKEYGDLEVRQQALMIGADDPDNPDGGETVTDEATKPDDKLLELRGKVSFAGLRSGGGPGAFLRGRGGRVQPGDRVARRERLPARNAGSPGN